MIAAPMSGGIVVRSQGPMLDDAGQPMHCSTLDVGIDDVRYGRFCNEVIEAIALVRDEQKVSSALVEAACDEFEVPDQIGLILDAMASDDR